MRLAMYRELKSVVSRGTIVLLAMTAGACFREGKKPPAVTTAPTEQPAAKTTAASSTTTGSTPTKAPAASPAPVAPTPAITPAPATQPAATQPAPTSKPASTYNSSPPYPVALYVRDADEPQPGWLRIVGLANEDQLATATGEFPEQNRILIDTTNVQRIRIHISHLPLNKRERTVLRIDNQPMVLITKKKRDYVYMSRRPTGEWVVEKSPDE